ncbi:acyl carrier protein phosphodiesterase [Algisphaera agarilytica]|uniref:Acyl carrier protein phosphodiesterase n=1 Tax=Algisphaera agarilytica TaxID=1385975 RepID=A0A7X0H7K2_9BACT|nr:ACP phosphodiesterase [Algisphaera agarilytica]MBB6430714.1 acyl carrier protein phosphodiesterase [Algisphaera agarilytica]
MNFLAHLYLADDSPASMIGNLLPDLYRGRLPDDLDPVVLRGVKRHRQVDVLTDSHPLFERSRARLRSKHGRYSGILVDVFYDHVLSVRWAEYHSEPLPDFIARAYEQILSEAHLMPPEMRAIMTMMAHEDWLSNYATVDGIAHTLRRMSARLRERFNREVDLASAAVDLREQYDGFAQDFTGFFPELMAGVGVEPRGRRGGQA